MKKLHLIGFTPGDDGLILTARKGSKTGGFVVPLDDSLLASIDQVRRRRAGEEPDDSAGEPRDGGERVSARSRPPSSLSPREIQSRLRSGSTIAEVAMHAGVDEEWVLRFAAPILAEQAQVVESAQRLTLVKQRRGPSAEPLAESVQWNLGDRGVWFSDDVFADCWSAFNLHGPRWAVRFAYTSRKRRQVAEWEVDLRQRTLVARNRLATELGHVEEGRRRPVHEPPDTGALEPAPASRGRDSTTAPTAQMPKRSAATKPTKATVARPAPAAPTPRAGGAPGKAAGAAASGPPAGRATPRGGAAGKAAAAAGMPAGRAAGKGGRGKGAAPAGRAVGKGGAPSAMSAAAPAGRASGKGGAPGTPKGGAAGRLKGGAPSKATSQAPGTPKGGPPGKATSRVASKAAWAGKAAPAKRATPAAASTAGRESSSRKARPAKKAHADTPGAGGTGHRLAAPEAATFSDRPSHLARPPSPMKAANRATSYPSQRLTSTYARRGGPVPGAVDAPPPPRPTAGDEPVTSTTTGNPRFDPSPEPPRPSRPGARTAPSSAPPAGVGRVAAPRQAPDIGGEAPQVRSAGARSPGSPGGPPTRVIVSGPTAAEATAPPPPADRRPSAVDASARRAVASDDAAATAIAASPGGSAAPGAFSDQTDAGVSRPPNPQAAPPLRAQNVQRSPAGRPRAAAGRAAGDDNLSARTAAAAAAVAAVEVSPVDARPWSTPAVTTRARVATPQASPPAPSALDDGGDDEGPAVVILSPAAAAARRTGGGPDDAERQARLASARRLRSALEAPPAGGARPSGPVSGHRT